VSAASQAKPRRAFRAAQAEDPARYTPGFSRRGGSLSCEDVPLEEIAARVGTPTYVYSAESITGAYRRLDKALGNLPHAICYAVKANGNLAILKLLAQQGSNFDIVSGGELYRLDRAGISGDRAVFSGVGKTREEIREALLAGVRLINVESEAELALLAAEAARLGRRAPASIRVNPDVKAGGHPHISTGRHQHKFGMDWIEARRLYLAYKDSPGIEWQGISAHIGSQILSVAPFQRALRRVASYVADLQRAGIKLRYLDFGGGLGVRYTEEQPPDVSAYAKALTEIVRPLGCELLLEPGRSIVAPAGVLLMRVLYTKRNRGKDFVIVDAAMNDFIRPALYDAEHKITPVRQVAAKGKNGTGKHGRVDVVGPVCETGDCFLHDWPLGNVAAGDLLVMWGTGAYGFSQASTYNARPRGAEVLVEGKSFHVIRRRESRADLTRGE
jgi:diaminopimelate decarboxylase